MNAVAAAWLLSLAIDLLLHAGVLAKLYVEPSPFLLGPQEAFRRIPLGYLSFLVLTVSLYWLLRKLDVRGASSGFRQGAVAGLVMWGAFTMGLYSISTVGLPLLVGWWLGQSLELGLAGAVLGAAADGKPMRRIWAAVAMVVVFCVTVTIVLQSTGWAPAMKVVE